MVFITAGMGGGTGTGAAPVIARAAREHGILTVGVVTKPFQFEGQRRMRLADAGIAELQNYVDTLIVIPNQNLFRVANEKTTFADAFAMADQVLHSGVACITDLMVKEGLINLDFADVRTVMREMGKAMMGTGEASGERRAIEAAEAAIANPLLDEVSMKGAKGLLISITGGHDLTLLRSRRGGHPHPRGSRPGRQHHLRRDLRRRTRRHDPRLGGRDRHWPAAARAAAVIEAPRAAAPQDRSRLTERLAGLAALPSGGPVDLDEPSLVLAPSEVVRDAPVWRAPGNVTIEKRPAQMGAMGLPLGAQKQAPAAPAQPFQPAPPAAVRRPVRRMPSVDQLPVVAQNAIKAKAAGDAPAIGLAAQKKKVGFLERLANVGKSRKDTDAEMPTKREPEFGQGYGSLAPEAPRMPAQRLEPRVDAHAPFGQKGIKIERPRGEANRIAGRRAAN